jgi:hypothetical protein
MKTKKNKKKRKNKESKQMDENVLFFDCLFYF